LKGSKGALERSLKFLFLDKYSLDGDFFDPNIEDEEIVGSLVERKELNERLEIRCDELFNVEC